MLTTGINRTHYGDKHRFNWGIASLFTNTNFNTAEGVNVELNGYVNRVYRNKIRVDFRPSFRYGFSNTHFNAWGQLRVRSIVHPDDPDQFKSTWILSGGKQPVQYNPYMPISPLINTFSSLFDGKNEMKIYEKTYVQTVYERKYLNGITWKLETGYENRNAILNTNLYTVSSIDKVNYRENLPEGKNIVSPGQSNSAWISSAEISIQPGQKYIQYPKRLVSMGSDYPVFTARYRKAIPAFGKTDADFDRWEFDVAGQRNFKLGGLFKYDFSVGGFLNTRKVYVQDMRHFNSRAIRATLSYVNGFQMMGSYLNSNQAPWVLEGHVEHHFNGMFTNKIPMFKKWNWFLVAGANAYWINPKDQYQEWFVGLENIFKIFRVDWVNAYQEGKYQGSSFVVGAGGLLGGAFTANEGERSVSISF